MTTRTRLRVQMRALMLLSASVPLCYAVSSSMTRRPSNPYIAHRLEAWADKPWATPAFVSHSFSALSRDSVTLVAPDVRLHVDQARHDVTVRDRLRLTPRPASWPAPRADRVVWCLGGSSTYCGEVPDDLTWPAFLLRELGPEFDVVNMGVAGATASAEARLLAWHLARRPAPHVVVAYDGWNDVNAPGQHGDHEQRARKRAAAHATMRALCAVRGATFVGVVQATLASTAGCPSPEASGLAALLRHDPASLDGRRLMPSPRVFCDRIHADDEGNAAIARFIAVALRARLYR
jgi:hypothetical protein